MKHKEKSLIYNRYLTGGESPYFRTGIVLAIKNQEFATPGFYF